MFKKTVSVVILALLVTSTLTLALEIQIVKADIPGAGADFYIRADGSVDPPTTRIEQNGCIYTLTDIIGIFSHDTVLVIEKSDIVFDGAGHSVQGPGSHSDFGIVLDGVHNVTLTHIEISRLAYCIWLSDSSRIMICENNISDTCYGIVLRDSSDNSICMNNITCAPSPEYDGINLGNSSNNFIEENNITNCGWYGICAHDNSINNHISHNNFVSAPPIVWGSPTVWDDGYPSGGNYWSNYTGLDLYSGPYQNESGSDGIGDTPYVIDANNTDHYPLMQPLGPYDGGTIYIRADGSIDPPTAPIFTVDSVTYTFFGNIVYSPINVARDNIVIDGAGYTLQGAGPYGPMIGIDLSGRTGVTVENIQIEDFSVGIKLDSSSNNKICENNIANGIGIWLNSSSGNNMCQNNMTSSSAGIEFTSSSNNTICNNNVSGCCYTAFCLSESSDNIISGNSLADVDYGIYLISSANNTVSGNSLANITSFGIRLDSSSDNVLCENEIVNSHNHGIILMGSDGNVVSANEIANASWIGIGVNTCFKDRIVGNVLRDNLWGVDLEGSSNVTITENSITGNEIGISLVYYSNHTIISENDVANNSEGIWYCSAGSRIFHNNFIDNKIQQDCGSFPPLTDSWDDGYPNGGNYWSDYGRTDTQTGQYQNVTGTDGIGDTPYVVDSNNNDSFPLIHPYEWDSLLDSTYSQVFQLSLEPVTGGWGIPNSEFALTLGEVKQSVSAGIDLYGLFDLSPHSDSFIAKVVWNIITLDANRDGKIDDNEMKSTLNSLLDAAGDKLREMTITGVVDQIRSASIPETSFDQIEADAAYILSLGAGLGAGAEIFSNIVAGAVGGSISPGLGLGIVSSGIVGLPAGLGNLDISIIGGSFQSICTACPVDIQVTTATGLVLNSTVNQIPGSQYLSRNCDVDGQPESTIVLPNNTGDYSLEIFPRLGANPTDNYSLAIGADTFQVSLLKNQMVQNISSGQIHISAYNETTVEEIGQEVVNNPDIGIVNLTSAKNVIGQGLNSSILISVQNEGNYTENLEALIFANSTLIASFPNITVSAGASQTLTFLWNTSGLAKGNYTLWAYLPLLTGETDTTDNTYVNGTIHITIPGDITGPNGLPDGKVDMRDIGYVARRFLCNPGDPLWDPNADINSDGTINMKDIGIAARNFQEQIP